jgi:hypothetical protein
MWRRVGLVRTDVMAEHACVIRAERIRELGTISSLLIRANFVTISPFHFTLRMEMECLSGTSLLRKTTRCHIPEDSILHIYRRDNLKSYITASIL